MLRAINKITELKDGLKNPEGLEVELKPFQLTTIDYMKTYEKMYFKIDTANEQDTYLNTSIGVLCNRAGSGKTYTVLGLITDTLDTPMEYNMRVQSQAVSYKKPPPEGDYVNTTLIYYPYYLREHWRNHLLKTKLKFYFYDYSSSAGNTENLAEYDVVLVSCKNVNNYCFPGKVFKRVVVDNLKKPSNVRENLPKRYFTWYMMSEYHDFYSKYSYKLNLNYLQFLKCKKTIMGYQKVCAVASRKYIPSYQPPLTLSQKNYIIEMLHQGRYSDVLSCMGIQGMSVAQIIKDRDGIITHERRDNMVKELVDYQKKECIICYTKMKMPVITTCCNIIICLECVVNILFRKSSCPCCRKFGFNINYITDTDQIIFLKKQELVITMIYENITNSLKTIVFIDNNYDGAIIKRAFGRHCSYTQGTYIKCLATINSWNDCEFNRPMVLVINNKFDYFSGIPIPPADEYIIVDRYSVQAFKQLSERIMNVGSSNANPRISVLSID
jgi:hypothetical protein